MSIWDAIILGIVQGLTEFLPVSSSGHLQLARELLGINTEVGGLTFDMLLHGATVLATIVVLWREIWKVNFSYILKIALSATPVVIVGFTLEPLLETLFGGLPDHQILLVVGGSLLVTAALLYFAYRAKPRAKETISYRDALIIGCAQAVAVLPGLSRSGSTIATGLMLGNRKEAVAQFSFLMVLVPVLGKIFLDLIGGEFTAQAIPVGPAVAGFVAAFASGAFACRFMINLVKRGRLSWFAMYCALVGLISIVSWMLL